MIPIILSICMPDKTKHACMQHAHTHAHIATIIS